MATVAVVFPSICKAVDRGEGIFIFVRDSTMPDKIDIISGFFENRFKTFFNPFPTGDFSSLYNSRTVIAIVTLTIEMKDEDSTAKCSPYSVGKANIIKGIPKKARLPKTVLKIKR